MVSPQRIPKKEQKFTQCEEINFISYSKLWLYYIWGEFLLLGERRSGCLPENCS